MDREILSSRSSLEGERKQVTVLFADVAGFTSLSEELDPEEVRDLMEPCLDIMTEGVQAYEGTVAQFTGDGIMALFGAPVAFEDAPVRAVRAAIGMRERLSVYAAELAGKGISFEVRIGLNTGLVVVGSMGSDQSVGYTAIGDTVNLASRMETAALPSTVLVSESTYRLLQGYFEFSDLGEIEVKGKRKPMHAYRVLGELPTPSRISASLTRGLSPFVGRERELDQLTYSYQQAKAGQGQVVGIVGEPGVGKSRLLLQFRELLKQEAYTYLEGGCIHYGEAIAYLPILGILRHYFDIQEGENETESKQKINNRLAALNGQLAYILPPLRELLSLEVDDQTYLFLEPAQRRERVFEAIRYLLAAKSEQRPLILAIEDLHWIDRTSEEFLTSFIESMPAANILLILLYRPEYTPAWVSKTFYSQIRVDHLPEKPSTELIRAILSGGEVSPELNDLIVTRSAGNPLFIEELTRSLLEAGSILKDNKRYILTTSSSDIQVPDTIQGIIASRLDRLQEELKETLQVASVIGREFSLRLLDEVTGISKPLKSYLNQIQSLEIIYEKSPFPEPEYTFKHALTQEVAYSSLLLKRRKEMHRRIGQSIERLYPEMLEKFYEILAYHYSRSEDAVNALTYLKLAGDKTTKDYSLWEAINSYREAIKLLDSWSETEERDREKVAIYLSILWPLRALNFPEGSLEILQEAERLAGGLADNASLAKIYSRLSFYHTYFGNLPLGMEYSEKSIDAAEKAGEIGPIVAGAFDICNYHLAAGNLIKVRDISHRVLTLLEEQSREKEFPLAGWTSYKALNGWYMFALGSLGDFGEAEAAWEMCERYFPESIDPFQVGWSEYCHLPGSFTSGDAESLIYHARKAIESFEEVGVGLLLGPAWMFLGGGYCWEGEYGEALDCAENGLKAQEEAGIPVNLPMVLDSSAWIRLAIGDLSSAIRHAEEALRVAQKHKLMLWVSTSLQLHGRIEGQANPSHIDIAQQYIQQGITLALELQVKPFAAQGYLYLGEILEIAGRKQTALENLRRAEQMYLKMGVGPDSYWLIRIREGLARLKPVF